MATPYVISSDLVSAYPAKSLEIAQYIDGFKADLALVQNAQTGTTYAFVAADFTKLVTLSNASPVAVELPLEATVPWPTGTQLRLLNQGAGTVTVAGAVGVTINGTPLTLAQYKGAALIKTGTDTWTFAPFSSGVGAAVYSDANTGTYTGYAYKTYTASGTLTITTAGFADVVVAGGGGGGGTDGGSLNLGGGGGGGVLVANDVYLPVGTLTVTVGAGGAKAENGRVGTSSTLEFLYGIGGGGGGGTAASGGGSGGGCVNTNKTPGSGVPGQGNNGQVGSGTANVTPSSGGGGGGASATPAAPSLGVGGDGGAGVASSITGTSVTYGGGGAGSGTSSGGAGGSGGGGGVNTNGTANTGGGGGAGATGGNGGSGIVIVRVAV
jgi:hypothetical protein